MKKYSAIFASIAILSGVAVFAAPPKKTAKAVDVWTCPMTGEAIKDHATAAKKTVVVAGKTVHFCCAGCPEKFSALSAKEQKAKVIAAAKKEAPAKKS